MFVSVFLIDGINVIITSVSALCETVEQSNHLNEIFQYEIKLKIIAIAIIMAARRKKFIKKPHLSQAYIHPILCRDHQIETERKIWQINQKEEENICIADGEFFETEKRNKILYSIFLFDQNCVCANREIIANITIFRFLSLILHKKIFFKRISIDFNGLYSML